VLRLLRSNADIRALFFAQVLSFCGDWFAYVAIVGVIQDLTTAPILVTLVYVCQALPGFFMSAVAGPVADRFDRKRIVQIASCIQAVAALGLLLVHSRGTIVIGYVCLVAIASFGAFVGPAAQASLPNLARSPEELKTASLMFGALWGAMLAIGAAVGGIFSNLFGRNAAFIANSISFVLAVGLVSLIRRPTQTSRAAAVERVAFHPLTDMREAVAYARHDKPILALMASKANFAVGAGLVSLLAVLVKRSFHGGDSATGLMLGARGVGVALGPIIANKFVGPKLSRVLAMCGSAGLVFGVCYLGLSIAPVLWVAAPLAFLAHLGGGAQWTLSTYGLQRRAPDHIRGRILAGDFGLVTLIITVSNLGAGLLAAIVGVRSAIAVFAVIGLLGGAAYLTLTRPLRVSLAAEEAEEAERGGGEVQSAHG
jgi:MFS family permease